MEQKIIRIEQTISYDTLRSTQFKIINSPYTFTGKVIYMAEYIFITETLRRYNINPLNVISYLYICGLATPYMVDAPMAAAVDGYTVILIATQIVTPESIRNNLYEEIKRLFGATYTISERKKLYKKLMLEHHPDKGGDLEIAKFINSFKNWK